MSMTDPISDLLTRVRNGSKARRETVDIPWSVIKEAVARVFVDEGYLREVAVTGDGPNKRIRAFIAYTESGAPVLTGLRRVSRPSLRVYRPARKVPVVRNGLGISVISTPEGVLADREARRRNIGGEVLCEVW